MKRWILLALSLTACTAAESATVPPDKTDEPDATAEPEVDASIDGTIVDAPQVDAPHEHPLDAPHDHGMVDASDASDADAPSDASEDVALDVSDATPVTLNGCGQNSYVDRGGAGDERRITFPMDVAPAQFSIPCMRVHVGQSIVFAGNFAAHPLEPSGGDSPNRFAFLAPGANDSEKIVSFDVPGHFGFDCSFHPSMMFGAVEVIP
jgi:plastocyanin